MARKNILIRSFENLNKTVEKEPISSTSLAITVFSATLMFVRQIEIPVKLPTQSISSIGRSIVLLIDWRLPTAISIGILSAFTVRWFIRRKKKRRK